MSNSECDDGFYCGGFECIPDPCTADTCERGECERGSEICVSKMSCTEETQTEDCVEGDECINTFCLNEESYCQSLDCERGVCDFAGRACVSADDCAGDSTKCLTGEFCNSDNACAPNLCEVNNIECDAGGVCDPELGECKEPEFCSTSEACLDDSICVFIPELSNGACLPRDLACGNGPGDGGCYGNQTCAYDSSSLVAKCEEVGSCQTSLDCSGDRQCDGHVCQDATACADDDFEPNNDSDSATDFMAEAQYGALRGSICQGDVDYYAIDIQALSNGQTQGALLVNVQYNRTDIGLGGLEVEVLAPDGNSLFTGDTGRVGIDGGIQSLVQIDTIIEGNYIVRVAGAEDLKSAGVKYTLVATFGGADIQAACQDAEQLVPGGPALTGDTREGLSTPLGSSCTSPENLAPEVIYILELARRSEVNVKITRTGTSSANLSANIRRACTDDTSEVTCEAQVTHSGKKLEAQLEAGLYYVVVQDANGEPGGPFKISATTKAIQCVQAENHCADENTLSRCDAAGEQIETITCSAGCDPVAVECRAVLGDTCAEAVEQTGAFSAAINWEDYSNSLTVAPGGCVPTDQSFGSTDSDGPDAIWEITLPAGKVLDATLTMAESEQGSIYILDNTCANTRSACLAGENAGNVTEQRLGYPNTTEDDKVVYLVADRSQYGRMSQASLDVELLDVVCDPTSAARCSTNDDVEKCNQWGTRYEVQRACSFGCAENNGKGECLPPTNDTCADPMLLEDGVPVTENITNYAASNKPAQTCAKTKASGPDAVYKVTTTQPNTKVSVTMSSSFDAVLYAGSACNQDTQGGVQACLAAADASSSLPEEILFVAPTPGDYFIFADAYSTTISGDGEFTITATFEEPSCVPGEALGCDGTSVKTCDPLGFPTSDTCRDTCVNSACYIAPGDTCEDPLPLNSGDSITANLDDFYPDYNLSSNSCTGKATAGSDVVYQLVTTAPGQIIELDLDATFNASLYISRDCVSTGSAPSCLAGSDVSGTAAENITFLAVEQGTYFVYVDASSSSASGTFTLSAEVRAPSCTPGEKLGCTGDTLSYCNDIGEATDYNCASTCSNAACDEPTGDVCHDAIALTDGVTVGDTVNGSGRTNSVSLSSGVNNQCIVGARSTTGKENIYRVDLLSGELLTVNIDTDSSALVSYISKSCVSAAQSCQAIDSNGKNGKLEYYAKNDESVFVIIDATDATSHDYTLDVAITSGLACAPGGFSCLDASTLQVCSRDGSEVLGEYVCAQGCSAGACAQVESPAACADSPSIGGVNAPNIGTGISVRGNFGALANHVSVPAGGCTGVAGNGPDLLYAVELVPGDVLEAHVHSAAGDDPMVYVLTDCGDPDSCQAGGAAQPGLNTAQVASTRFLSESTQTVYVVADSKSASASNPFRLDISVWPSECNAGETSCVDSRTEKFCDAGLDNQRTCHYGVCSGGATGSCSGTAPDTCADAILVPNDGQVYTYGGPLSDFSNTVNLGHAMYECSGHGPSPGRDAIYAVDLTPGKILTATVTSPGQAVLWIANSCGSNMVNTCFDTAEATGTNGSATLKFAPPIAGTYYLVADNKSPDISEGEFTIDIQVDDPECTPYASQCLDANTLRRCSRDGIWTELSCYYGCENDACGRVVGNTCGDAVVVPNDRQRHTFQGRMEDFTDTSDLADAAQSCDGRTRTPGPEVFYAVQMQAGDILDVAWTSTGDGIAWLADSCADAPNSCLVAVDSGNPESFSFTATFAGTYYVVADNWSSSTTSGEFSIDIHVHGDDCDSGTFDTYCADESTLMMCSPTHAVVGRNCICENDTCLEGGNTCNDAPDITAHAAQAGGIDFQGAYADFTKDFSDGYCGASSFKTGGADFVYAVDLAANETVTVSVESSSLTYPSIFFVESCADLAANACLAAAVSSSASTTGSYTAPTAQRVYVVIDNDSVNSSNDYDVNVTIQ